MNVFQLELFAVFSLQPTLFHMISKLQVNFVCRIGALDYFTTVACVNLSGLFACSADYSRYVSSVPKWMTRFRPSVQLVLWLYGLHSQWLFAHLPVSLKAHRIFDELVSCYVPVLTSADNSYA